MKKINLQRLTLRNFKGITDLTAAFTLQNQINGDNATGKTTVFDAYTWLLYGKNSHNQADFNIKTLDQDNNPIQKLEHEVEGEFNVDDKVITFKRCYFEKWVTPKGQEKEVLRGHETKYFVDDVPLSKGDYEIKVRDMIEESISKIISSTEYFNESLKWTDRRIILERMAGEVSNNEILEAETKAGRELVEVAYLLDAGKRLEDEKLKIGAQKKKLKDELKLIPSRIDEVDRGKPEALDFKVLESKLTSINLNIEDIDTQILDKNKAIETQREAATQVKTDKYNKEQELTALERGQTANVVDNSEQVKLLSTEQGKLNDATHNKAVKESSISANRRTIERLTTEKSTFRTEWDELKALTFVIDAAHQTCPTCNREMDNAQDTIDTAKATFNTNKANKLRANEDSGRKLAGEIKELETKNTNLAEEIVPIQSIIDAQPALIKAIKDQINKPAPAPKPTAKMVALKKEIEAFVIPTVEAPDTQALKITKGELETERDQIKKDLGTKETIDQANKRKDELTEQQRNLGQQVATLERTEFQIDAFNKAKVTQIENRVNSKFSLVKFKMFEGQINGGESPTCVCMVNGVPYSDVNTADQINASLDVINALQYHYNIFAPVFIDHRESVVNLYQMECQTISLKVDETAPELQILNLK